MIQPCQWDWKPNKNMFLCGLHWHYSARVLTALKQHYLSRNLEMTQEVLHPCTTVRLEGRPPWLLHMRLVSAALLLLPQGKRKAGFGAQLVKTKSHVKCALRELSWPKQRGMLIWPWEECTAHAIIHNYGCHLFSF